MNIFKHIWGILAVMVLLIEFCLASFDSVPVEPSTKLEVEERGVNFNLASLFILCDAVVVCEKKHSYKQGKLYGVVFQIKECLWSRNGETLTEDIYVASNPSLYQDNRRNLGLYKMFDEREFHYMAPSLYQPHPKLLFLRKGVVSLELREGWKLGELPVFKVVNGGQGCVHLNHLKASWPPVIKNNSEKIKKLLKAIMGRKNMKTFGTKEAQEIERFVRAFYAGKLTQSGGLKKNMGKKLREDALALIMDLARPFAPPKSQDKRKSTPSFDLKTEK